VRGLGTKQEVRVHINGSVGPTGTVDTDGNAAASLAAQIAIHAEGTRNVFVIRQKHFTHRHRLRGLLRDLSEDRSRVEADLRPLGGGDLSPIGRAIVAKYVVKRCL
jgi:hypothetical protein